MPGIWRRCWTSNCTCRRCTDRHSRHPLRAPHVIRIPPPTKDFLLDHSGGQRHQQRPEALHPVRPDRHPRRFDAAAYFNVQPGDPRVPDLLGITQVGVVYTGGTGKIAEHGGANTQPRNVPLIVSGNPIGHHRTSTQQVETTQIAPTILTLLGLNPHYLQAVQIEHTTTLNVR